MTREELIEKDFLPKQHKNFKKFKQGFTYEARTTKKITAKKYDGTILCKSVDYFEFLSNGYEFRKNGKFTYVNSKGNTIFDNVDYFEEYYAGFVCENNGEEFFTTLDGVICEEFELKEKNE